eukprot:3294235-Prymnesium_polylepis.1
MVWYRCWTVTCQLHHRATSRAESGEEQLRRRTSQLDHLLWRSPANVSAASVRQPRTQSDSGQVKSVCFGC